MAIPGAEFPRSFRIRIKEELSKYYKAPGLVKNIKKRHWNCGIEF
jgi:hypothetical protein